MATLGRRIDPSTARVEVDGVLVPVAPDLVYYLLNKPDGVITTADDPQGRPTVIDAGARRSPASSPSAGWTATPRGC